MRFADRTDAGKKLAGELTQHSQASDTLLLALPRGGVPVAYEVATQLRLPMDTFLVRKLGLPGQKELAIGAIASGGVRVLNEDVIRSRHVSPQTVEDITQEEEQELLRREQLYRSGRPAYPITGKTIILIDDGLATGASMRAAVTALRQQHPKAIIVAVPVASGETCDEFRHYVDIVVCVLTPQPFYGVGMWYDNFSQTTDAEVQDLLQRASLLN